jgi:hypothetical protein
MISRTNWHDSRWNRHMELCCIRRTRNSLFRAVKSVGFGNVFDCFFFCSQRYVYGVYNFGATSISTPGNILEGGSSGKLRLYSLDRETILVIFDVRMVFLVC